MIEEKDYEDEKETTIEDEFTSYYNHVYIVGEDDTLYIDEWEAIEEEATSLRSRRKTITKRPQED